VALLTAGVRLAGLEAGEGFWDPVLSRDLARRSRSSRRRLSFLPVGKIHMSVLGFVFLPILARRPLTETC
jgi:hypothetical protein